MERMTKALGNGQYTADESKVQHDETGYTGEAIHKLAKYENIHESLLSKQVELSKQMEKLRLEGKSNTVLFKQLLANKLMNNEIITLFETYL